MKYTPYITILAVLLATACAKEEIKEDQQLALPENGIRFSGTMGADDPADSPSTRTVYEDQEDRIAVQWELGDEIGLFCEVGEGADNLELTAGNYGYRNKTVADSKTADFSEYLLPGEVVCWSDETTHKITSATQIEPVDRIIFQLEIINPNERTSSGSVASSAPCPIFFGSNIHSERPKPTRNRRTATRGQKRENQDHVHR